MVDLKPRRLLSWQEVRKHTTLHDAWIVIHHKVYDISNWDAHPGGRVAFMLAGEDATDVFSAMHKAGAFKLLAQFYIGDVDESTRGDGETSAQDPELEEKRAKFIAAFRQLRVKAKSIGLFDASAAYYVWKVVSTFGLCVVSALMCFVSDNFAVYMVAACIMGLFYQQSAWLAHDFAHQQVFANRRHNTVTTILLGNVWQGFSVQWWKNKHNMHHAIPNIQSISEGDTERGFSGDPDIDTTPFLVWSNEQASTVFGSAFDSFMVKHQAHFYFPLLLFARLNWMTQSYQYVFNQKGSVKYQYDPVEFPLLEKIGLVVYLVWKFALMYAVGMSLREAVAFFFVSQAAGGMFLAIVFSVGHNGMAIYDRETKPEFWKLQVSAARNIRSSPFIDWFMGGLNYQIDHHLFPMMPRHSFRKLNELTKSLCKEHDIPFYEVGFWQGTFEVVGHLNEIAKEFITEFPAM